jgi:hypothetical protein
VALGESHLSQLLADPAPPRKGHTPEERPLRQANQGKPPKRLVLAQRNPCRGNGRDGTAHHPLGRQSESGSAPWPLHCPKRRCPNRSLSYARSACERPAAGCTTAWANSWTTAMPIAEIRKETGVSVNVARRNGVMVSHSTAISAAVTMPIGRAMNCISQGRGSRTGFHEASGAKSGDVGTAPKWKRITPNR